MERSDDIFVSLPISQITAIKDMQICFCIDISGSTSTVFADKTSVLHVEYLFVDSFKKQLSKTPFYVAWDDQASIITDLSMLCSRGNTEPACIFENPETNEIIRQTEVIVMITDGEIGADSISRLCGCMINKGAHIKAVIGVIVGRRTDPHNGLLKRPSNTNASVLIPAMISNSCILFYNWHSIYVMWTGGAFYQEWSPNEITDGTDWTNVTCTTFEHLVQVNISYPDTLIEIDYLSNGYIPLGMGRYFNPNIFLRSSPDWEQLQELPFDRICQYFKVTLRCTELLEWASRQKDRFLLKFAIESDSSFHRLLDEILDQKNEAIINRYRYTRDSTLIHRYIDDEDLDQITDDPRVCQLVKFFRNMMRIISEDQRGQHHSSSYTISTISRSRYAFQSSTSSDRQNVICGFTEPLKWIKRFKFLYPKHESQRFECSICCEMDIPFILLRKHFDVNNLEDIAIHPLDYLYPHLVCSKCAEFFCVKGQDPFRVSCYAAIPLVRLIDNSKKKYLENFMDITNITIFEDSSKHPENIRLVIQIILSISNELIRLHDAHDNTRDFFIDYLKNFE